MNERVKTMDDNYTTTRAGYLDNLSAGAAALEATLTAIKGAGWSTETLKAILDNVLGLLTTTKGLYDIHDDLGAVGGYVDEVESLLKNATYGLSALRTRGDAAWITATALSAAGVDAIHDEVVEGSTTLRQTMRLIMSALFGKLSGGGTTTLTFRDIGDSKDRLTVTVDANKNRTAVTKDAA